VKARSPFGPLLAWSLPQLAVLILVTNQIPWLPAKSMPRPAEVAALQVMLFVQFTAAALLLPLIFRDLVCAVLVMLVAAPMTLLASFLSGEAAKWKMLYAVSFVQVWLLALACWSTILRSPRALTIGTVTALSLLLADPIASFISSEYGGGSHARMVSPLMDALHASQQGVLTHGEIARLGGFCATGIIAAIIVLTSHGATKHDFDTNPLSPTP